MKEYLSPKMDILYVNSTDIMAMSVNTLGVDGDFDSENASNLEF